MSLKCHSSYQMSPEVEKMSQENGTRYRQIIVGERFTKNIESEVKWAEGTEQTKRQPLCCTIDINYLFISSVSSVHEDNETSWLVVSYIGTYLPSTYLGDR